MNKILIIGLNPHTLDFSLPGFPPGLTAEKVENGLNAEMENLKTLGYDPELYLMDSGIMELTVLEDKLKATTFAGILIGAGIRVPPSTFMLFEKLINTIHEKAPTAKIIFNTNPLDTADSIQRWITAV